MWDMNKMETVFFGLLSFVIGVVVLGWVIRQLRTGYMQTHTGLHHIGGKKSSWVKKEEARSKFWTTIIFEVIAAVVFIYFAIDVLFLRR